MRRTTPRWSSRATSIRRRVRARPGTGAIRHEPPRVDAEEKQDGERRSIERRQAELLEVLIGYRRSPSTTRPRGSTSRRALSGGSSAG
jgi:hypothetical protein